MGEERRTGPIGPRSSLPAAEIIERWRRKARGLRYSVRCRCWLDVRDCQHRFAAASSPCLLSLHRVSLSLHCCRAVGDLGVLAGYIVLICGFQNTSFPNGPHGALYRKPCALPALRSTEGRFEAGESLSSRENRPPAFLRGHPIVPEN